MMTLRIAIFLYALPLLGNTLAVKSGEKISEAVKKAKNGDVIEVYPGRYVETVIIDRENISLVGKRIDGKRPVLDGEKRLNDGVIVSGSGFTIEGFLVENYKGNGIMTQGANDVVIRDLDVRYTGIYGIYPTRGKNILVERTRSWGISDAAIYIGMCENVDVRHNEVFANVAGIEAENSTDVLIEHNSVHDNSGGILVFNLPGLPIKHGERAIIRRNSIVANNHKNFGIEGSIVSTIPQGSGIILLAADKVIIEDNVIQDNHGSGILIADHEYIKDVAAMDPLVEPNPDHNQILFNEFLNNGGKPRGMLRWALLLQFFTLKGKDIISTDKGVDNCIAKGIVATTKGLDGYVACGGDSGSGATLGFYTPGRKASGQAKMPMGEQLYQSVCAGCHAMGMVRVGPPIEEIQKKYANNPSGIVSFASAPKPVRPHWPLMPSQAYLGEEKLKAVADYLLKMR